MNRNWIMNLSSAGLRINSVCNSIWGRKLLKELLAYEGRAEAATGSPREIIKAAYTVYDFMDETVWLDMLRDRNTSTHIYDGEEVRRLAQRVIDRYIPAFERMWHAIDARYADVLDEL